MNVETALNEHAALEAVAEAALDCDYILESMDLRAAHQCSATALKSALAALVQVRKKGGK